MVEIGGRHNGLPSALSSGLLPASEAAIIIAQQKIECIHHADDHVEFSVTVEITQRQCTKAGSGWW